MKKDDSKNVILDIDVSDDDFSFSTSVENALENAEDELQQLEDDLDSLKNLKPQCDKLDYALAASSGAICGIIDIFLVNKPGDSALCDVTDEWFDSTTRGFARLCGWKGESGNTKSAIKYLEGHFKIPYDQTTVGGAAKDVFDLNSRNHHFKSLGHNPSLFGLFFSVLDQFANTSHFVSGGELLSLQDAAEGFELHANTFVGKLFCGFANWFGHIVSDMSGCSKSAGRGMGIPSPLWCWTNSIIAIKSKLNIPVLEFNKQLNKLALEIYDQGYDMRFQFAQSIPVFINEIIVRFLYSVRRLVSFCLKQPKEEINAKSIWNYCKPFGNSTVKRMLTVAHGTFCLIDFGDATVRSLIVGGGVAGAVEFVLRFNVVGLARFSVSLYGEFKRVGHLKSRERVIDDKKEVLKNYVGKIKLMSYQYRCKGFYDLTKNLLTKGDFRDNFEKSAVLSKNIPALCGKVLTCKEDIDNFFMVGDCDEEN